MNARLLIVSAVAFVGIVIGAGCSSDDAASPGESGDSGAAQEAGGGSVRDGSSGDAAIQPSNDSGADASSDSAVDSGDDAEVDAADDASSDAESDASIDAGDDASEDAGADAGPAPAFITAPTVSPNVLLGGTMTAGLLKFALPTLATGTATSVSFTVSSGGAPTAVTKTGGTAIVPGDLGTVVSVDPPATSSTDRKTFTYSLSASDAESRVSNTETTTVDVYPDTATLADDRVGGTATFLSEGKVLLIGGGSGIKNGVCATDGNSNTAEIYDVTTGATTAVSTKMVAARCQHSAVLAGNGKVYVLGGANTLSIDVFDVASGAFQQTSLPTLSTKRTAQTATLLGSASSSNSGKIVIAGGYTPGTTTAISSIELFDPGTGTSALYTSTTSVARAEQTATLMGKWLMLVGGTTTNASIDALDTTTPVTSTTNIVTTSAPTHAVARFGHAAVALDASSFLVAGGIGSGSTLLGTMQTYTINTSGTVTAVSTAQDLATARARFALVSAGVASKYLAVGGTTALAGAGSSDTPTGSVEEIDSSGTLTASSFATLLHARQALAATSLSLSSATNAVFLVAGGATSADAELLLGP